MLKFTNWITKLIEFPPILHGVFFFFLLYFLGSNPSIFKGRGHDNQEFDCNVNIIDQELLYFEIAFF